MPRQSSKFGRFAPFKQNWIFWEIFLRVSNGKFNEIFYTLTNALVHADKQGDWKK